MYRSIRIIRIVMALVTLAVPTVALVVGYDSVFRNMQILTALISGSIVSLIFWLLATWIYGRIYCSVICPLGTAMDCAAALERLASRRRRAYRYTEPSNRVRWVFLSLAVIFVLVGGPLLPTLLDPYTEYARMVENLIVRPLGRSGEAAVFTLSSFAVASLVFIGIVLCSWRRGRIICNTVCPVGTLLGVAARPAVFHPDIDTDKCINCGECERVCKAGCINLIDHTVDTSRCVVCFDCMAVCPNNAITYRQGRHRLGMPMMQATDGPREAFAAPDKNKASNETVS